MDPCQQEKNSCIQEAVVLLQVRAKVIHVDANGFHLCCRTQLRDDETHIKHETGLQKGSPRPAAADVPA